MERLPQAADAPQSKTQSGGLQAGEADIGQLLRDFRQLEQRVQALEQRLNGNCPRTAQALPLNRRPQAPQAGAARAIPVFGEAFLGLAGAYLLRALSEYKLVPLAFGVTAGIVYAAIWLFFAARAGQTRRVAATVRGGTSALILAPLLWEATFQFGALSHWTATGVIVAYLCLGLALSWRSRLSATAWTTTLAAITSAAALLLGTHDLVPFTLALLFAAVLMEFAACFGRWPSQRWTVAVIADLTVLFLASIAGREGGVPEAYVPVPATNAIALQVALPLIYLFSTSLRALALGVGLSIFEIIQIALVLLLSITGVLHVDHGSRMAAGLVAAFCLGCGTLFYGCAFHLRDFTHQPGRNFHAYSWLGLLLFLTGGMLWFSGVSFTVLICGLAFLALLLARWTRQASLGWHATVYLLLATALSGLGPWTAANLLGSGHGWKAPAPGAAITAAAAIAAYALSWEGARDGPSFSTASMPLLAIAGMASWGVAGLAAGGLSGLCGGVPVVCASLRTFILTAMAIVLALCGTTWRRRELVWLMYPFMALAAYKLLVQDLPRGQTVSLFLSLFLYGGALILLPRILQKSRRSTTW